MRLWKHAALPCAALLAMVALVACGDDGNRDDPTQTIATTSTQANGTQEATATNPPATATPTESSSGGAAARCTADDIELALLPAGGAAGTHFVALSVKNTSGDDCSVSGYPGVSLIDASGQALGEPAERNPAVSAEVIVLEPGESAHAMLGLPNHQNFPVGACDGPSASLRMYPPDGTEALTVPFEDHACPGMSVRAFEPGANEPGRN